MDMQNVSNLVIPEGEVRTIHDEDSKLLWGRVSYDVKYSGDATQDGTPTPDSPVPVQTVTGEQTVSISDGNGNTQSYPISLGSTELCKLGEYQDYIYKSGNDWYVHKAIGKYTFTGTENWSASSYGTNSWYRITFTNLNYDAGSVIVLCDLAQGVSYNDRSRYDNPPVSVCYGTSNGTFWLRNTAFAALADLQAATNGKNVYYWMTPTDTKITDNTLIGQLNAVHQFLTRYGYNATVSGNLPLIIDKTSLQKGQTMAGGCGGKKK